MLSYKEDEQCIALEILCEHAELHGVVFAFTMLAVPGRTLHTQTFSAWHLLQVTCVASVAEYKLVAAVCAATSDTAIAPIFAT